jgi:hypothetical protein
MVARLTVKMHRRAAFDWLTLLAAAASQDAT